MKQPLATLGLGCQLHSVDEPRTIINLEETIGKQVGRRKPPTDPLRVADSTIQRRSVFNVPFPAECQSAVFIGSVPMRKLIYG